jgi:formylmethanofuran dehydrogenase subunit E
MLECVMVDPKEFLKAGLQLHGRKCPEMILGLRAGAAAMNWLGVERSVEDQLLALLELPEGRWCFGDGIQAITGCTLGKGNVRVAGRGPLSLTLIEQATRRAVRVVPKVDIPPSRVPDAAAEALLRRLLTAPGKQILSVGEEFRYEALDAVPPQSAAPAKSIDEGLTAVKAGDTGAA